MYGKEELRAELNYNNVYKYDALQQQSLNGVELVIFKLLEDRSDIVVSNTDIGIIACEFMNKNNMRGK